MDFEQRLRHTLSGPSSPAERVKDRLEEVRGDVGQALRAVMRVYASATRYITGAKVLRPGNEPAEPAFFVTGLQAPRQQDYWYHAARLFVVACPVATSFAVGETTRLRIVRVVGIGDHAYQMSVRRFMIAWNGLRMGGSVIYEGDIQPETMAEAVEADLVDILKELPKVMETYRYRDVAVDSLLWPIDLEFQPPLCRHCLMPEGCGPVCIACRRVRWAPPL